MCVQTLPGVLCSSFALEFLEEAFSHLFLLACSILLASHMTNEDLCLKSPWNETVMSEGLFFSRRPVIPIAPIDMSHCKTGIICI